MEARNASVLSSRTLRLAQQRLDRHATVELDFGRHARILRLARHIVILETFFF
jgi:hypothetical protein